MKIGIIGTGNMGTILLEALIDGKVITPSSMVITNRTLSKANNIQKNYPTIHVAKSAKEVARQAELLFICVKPGDVFTCIQDIRPYLSVENCVVSITSPISSTQLDEVLPCSSARAIPSITNRALAGVSLLTFGKNCSPYWRETLTNMLSKISKPVEIEEIITRVASDIVSCGPAFFSYLIRRFVDGAVAKTEIDEETATILASEMMIGMGELLRKGFYTLPTLQEKVCVKGGITGEGIKVLEKEVGSMFEHLFQATHTKFAEDKKETEKHFTISNPTNS